MRWVSAILAGLMAVGPIPSPAQDKPATGLNIVIIEGAGAINNVRQRTARAPIIQVEDQNRRPVAGAAVVFMLPERGASGIFPNGSRTVTMMTDNQGRAVARGIRLNKVQGRMDIRVTASHQGRTAAIAISQTNAIPLAAAAGMGIGLKVLIIAATAAGLSAAGVAVARSTGGDNTSTAGRTATVTPGAGTVGPPR
ncbi:MAG TPA: hypothetical protein VN442_21150 [Bryobacteraceae bacterium]|nr:hypothetical protein [Bryobacteraceae bacterium]